MRHVDHAHRQKQVLSLTVDAFVRGLRVAFGVNAISGTSESGDEALIFSSLLSLLPSELLLCVTGDSIQQTVSAIIFYNNFFFSYPISSSILDELQTSPNYEKKNGFLWTCCKYNRCNVARGPFKCYVMQWGWGVSFPGRKRYEGVRFNVIRFTRGRVGVKFPAKSVT